VVVDWMVMTPYQSPCTFDSQLFDSTASGSDWTTLSDPDTLADPNVETAVSFETRTGSVTPVDGTWSAFEAVVGGAIASPNARFLQYRASLSSTDPDQTPSLGQVDIDFTPCTPTGPEVCDGTDNDCNGEVDEGTGGDPCDTGEPGVCADSTDVCVSGVLECPQTIFPSAELCNSLDDDCDGTADEDNPEGGSQCGTTDVGECAYGAEECQSGSLVCVGNIEPVAELCDGLDNDCDGTDDNGNPEGGSQCGTTDVGECAYGAEECQSGSLVCVGNIEPVAELCDGLDNDCDGTTDEGNPEGGGQCGTTDVGECEYGVEECQLGSLVCVGNIEPVAELCDGLDNDCDGTDDNGNPEGGGQCGTTDVGECAYGAEECQLGSLVCVGDIDPVLEVCDDGLDNDCDGETDDEDACGAIPQSPVQQNCINELNKGFAKVAKAQGKDIVACVKNGSKGKLGAQSIEECLTADNKGKVAKAVQKTLAKAPPKCSQPPDFGATDASTVNQVAVEKELALIHEIFGSDLDDAILDAREESEVEAAKCQVAVAKAGQKCHDAKLKEFNKCKKAGLKEGSIERVSELKLCMGVDPKGKIAKACDTKLSATVSKKCPGSVDLAGAFPGCNTGDPGLLAACVDRIIACRACLALNEADVLNRDCDLFDDTLDNDSCP
jgi:hypothetical protein